eukprot:GDKH01006600.1.p1 GENE.GDKH01006600.1~~GDKH01006600.1.p1  ORF type:complete len:51 (+),score=0.19 GDKH01006600.1:18-170(+)
MYLSNIKIWNFRKFGTEGEMELKKTEFEFRPNQRVECDYWRKRFRQNCHY